MLFDRTTVMKLVIASAILLFLTVTGFNQPSSKFEAKATVPFEFDLTDCVGLKKEDQEKAGIIKTNNQKIVFFIPPPSGPGTGVCDVTLSIEKMQMTGTENCGGHDENGHTESTIKLFKVPFVENQFYKVSDLIDTTYESSFGCAYFEIKGGKLYLYDENKNIINDWFCTFGKIENRKENMETCDCIFMPSEN